MFFCIQASYQMVKAPCRRITQHTTQDTGERGPLDYKGIRHQRSVHQNMHMGIPTCLLQFMAKRPGSQIPRVRYNPYSLMHGNTYGIAGGTEPQRKEKTEREREGEYI